MRSVEPPSSAIWGRRTRSAGTRPRIAARGNLRWPPGVVKLATWPRSAQRRSVPWLMPRTLLASPRLSQVPLSETSSIVPRTLMVGAGACIAVGRRSEACLAGASPTCWGRWREAPEEPEDATFLPPPLAGGGGAKRRRNRKTPPFCLPHLLGEVARSAGGGALLRSVRRLRADEEEVAHEEDEEPVLDHHVTGQRLLHRVPDDAAIDVPEEQQHDGEETLAEEQVHRHGPGEEGHQLGDEEREEEGPPGRHRPSQDPEGAVAGQKRDHHDRRHPERQVQVEGQHDEERPRHTQRHDRLLDHQVARLGLVARAEVV